MIQTQADIVVNVPNQDAFRFLSDLCNEPAFNPHAARVHKISTGPVDRGSQYQATYKGAGTFRLEITEYEYPKRITFTGAANWLHYTITYRLEPAETGVRLLLSMRGTFQGPMRLLEPLMGVVFRRRFSNSARYIKEVLESRKAES
jgi:hypothetical protein